MKKLKISSIIFILIILTNFSFGQSAVKQSWKGNKAVVTNASNALGADLSKYSVMQFRSEDPSSNAYVSQNFTFASMADSTARVAFIVKLEDKFTGNMNLRFYTTMEDKTSADSVSTDRILVTTINEALNLYEISFMADKKFDTSGIVMYGEGAYRKVKIYRVYLTINNDHRNSMKFTSAKK